MKNFVKIVVFAALISGLMSCAKEKTPRPEPGIQAYIGEWKLVEDSYGLSNSGEIEIYLSLSGDGTFKLTQKLGDVAHFSNFSGTYAVSHPDDAVTDGFDAVISGSYDDGTPWACDYYLDCSTAPDTLVMVSTDGSHSCTYLSHKWPK